MRVLITSGGTQNPVDDVRWMGNFSTGKFGARITRAFLNRGHHVSLLHSERAERPDRLQVDLNGDIDQQIEQIRSRAAEWLSHACRYSGHEFVTAESYERELNSLLTDFAPEIVVLAAAVADYVPATPRTGKIPSKANSLSLELRRVPKYIAGVRDRCPDAFLVGFKLLSHVPLEELLQAARAALKANRADVVVANDLQSILQGLHTVHLVRNDTVETYRSADDPADRLAERVLFWAKERRERD